MPTFKEEPCITREVVGAIVAESKSLLRPIYFSVVSTEAELASIVVLISILDPQKKYIKYIPVLDPGSGKRGALFLGLKSLVDYDFSPNGIVALMDGDSVVDKQTFKRALGCFMSNDKLGALTTNETPLVAGPAWFSSWLDLRFMQRHMYMCSYALTNRIMCLTGRFSFFRANLILNPDFRNQLVNDMLSDWLWGDFRFFLATTRHHGFTSHLKDGT